MSSKVQTASSPSPNPGLTVSNTEAVPIVTDVHTSAIDGYQTKSPSLGRAFDDDKDDTKMSKTIVVEKKKPKLDKKLTKEIIKESSVSRKREPPGKDKKVDS